MFVERNDWGSQKFFGVKKVESFKNFGTKNNVRGPFCSPKNFQKYHINLFYKGEK